MNRIYRKSPFWSLAGPLLGYLAIEGVIQFALMFLIEMPYIVQAYTEVLSDNSGAALSMQEILDSYMRALEPALEAIAKYISPTIHTPYGTRKTIIWCPFDEYNDSEYINVFLEKDFEVKYTHIKT